MSWDYQKLVLWGLTLLASVLGIWKLIVSIVALKKGTVVLINPNMPNEIQISPWTEMAISGAFLIFAIVGIIKIWKDKDKYPPL